MGGWGSWSFGATGWLLEGLDGVGGEARGGLAWGVAALKPVMCRGLISEVRLQPAEHVHAGPAHPRGW